MAPSASSPGLRTSSRTGGSGVRRAVASCGAVTRLAGAIALGRAEERALGFAQVAGDAVEADPGEPDDDLLLAVLWGDHHDLLVGAHDHARGLGEPAVRRDVEGAGQMACGELLRVTGVDHAPRRPAADPSTSGRSSGRAWRAGSNTSCARAVEHRVVDEVVRGGRLPRGHQSDELVLVHRLTRVVPGPLARRSSTSARWRGSSRRPSRRRARGRPGPGRAAS